MANNVGKAKQKEKWITVNGQHMLVSSGTSGSKGDKKNLSKLDNLKAVKSKKSGKK